MSVQHLQYLSDHEKWIQISEHESLLNVMKLLSMRDVHRIGISDKTGKVIDILTQSEMMEFLVEKSRLYGKELVEKKVRELDTQSKDVRFVYQHEILIKALSTMWNEKISGVAVVSKDGRLIGNVSSNDLKVKYWSY